MSMRNIHAVLANHKCYVIITYGFIAPVLQCHDWRLALLPTANGCTIRLPDIDAGRIRRCRLLRPPRSHYRPGPDILFPVVLDGLCVQDLRDQLGNG